MRLSYIVPVLLVLVTGCGKKGNTDADMIVTVMPDLSSGPMTSVCGHPGDKGNSLGVGKYCTKLDDCAGNSKASLCSTLGNDPMHPEMNAYFCLFPCSKTSPPDFCGENALCECAAAGCGCTPTACVGSADGGTASSDM